MAYPVDRCPALPFRTPNPGPVKQDAIITLFVARRAPPAGGKDWSSQIGGTSLEPSLSVWSGSARPLSAAAAGPASPSVSRPVFRPRSLAPEGVRVEEPSSSAGRQTGPYTPAVPRRLGARVDPAFFGLRLMPESSRCDPVFPLPRLGGSCASPFADGALGGMGRIGHHDSRSGALDPAVRGGNVR